MPGPDHRVTKQEFLSRAAKLLARLAMGVASDQSFGTKFCPSPTFMATSFANTVGDAAPDPLGPQYSLSVGQGFKVKDLFAAARKELTSELADLAGMILDDYYTRISDSLNAIQREREVTTVDVQEVVAHVLVRDFDQSDGTPFGLWLEYALKHYPDSGYVRLALQNSSRLRPIENPLVGAEVDGAW